MHRRHRETFITIKTEGNLLPVDLLQRIAEGDGDIDGLTPDSYHLTKNERLNEVINRAWSRCESAWRGFQSESEILPEIDAGTTITRERWLLTLFQELGYGRLLTAKSREIGGKTYPISHNWHHTPIHLVTFRQDLDQRTPGVVGAARMSPHSLVQEFLNRSEDQLWGIVSNGLKLRLLRDNASLTRQAYVEFDLEGMMSGEVYSDFILLFMLLHQSRVEAERPERCWLERWTQEAQKQGTRALDHLRDGVEQAIKSFGQGFLAHPANINLRQKLQSGERTTHDLYQQLLRLVYRLIFLFVAEDRNLLLLPVAKAEARKNYIEHYSLARIRRIAGRLRGTRHGDLWQGMKVTFRCLAEGEPALGLNPLGGFLFSPEALANLNDSELSNDALLSAVRHLSFTQDNRTLRPIDYRNLGTEELGSVYESLLELHPEVNVSAYTFDLKVTAGSERKTTGSYYTPTSLINCLLDSALEPVIEDRLKEAKRIANSEIANRGREYYVRYILSGSQGLATEHGTGRRTLPYYQGLSKGGDVRNDIPDQTGISGDSGEHRGGLGTVGDEGVHSVSSDSTGQLERAGNPPDTRSTGGASAKRADKSAVDPVQRTGQDAFPNWFFAAQSKVGPNSLPPYSLLAEKALLSLKVVDPACGSGHFLIAAAHRIAKHLAMVRTGEAEPAPEERRKALRDVVSHCIYGVDVNPLAVELCKVAMWIETLDPGRPLGFLDHHVKCGNSLIGATPELLENGIPDDAFKPVEGDDKGIASAIRKKNREERGGQQDLFAQAHASTEWQQAVEEFQAWGTMPENAYHQVCEKAAQYETLCERFAYRQEKEVADLWTAAFFWPITKDTATTVPTEDIFRRLQEGDYEAKKETGNRMKELGSKHRFFHWHLEFPEVFTNSSNDSFPPVVGGTEGGGGGFDCVLGNPPWERIKLQEKEFFAQKDPEISIAPNAAARRRLIAELPETNSELWEEFQDAKRISESESHFARTSGRYPLSAIGDINTYQLFTGLARRLISGNGRAGIVIPSGIATDDTNKKFFSDLTEKRTLVSLYDFENREGIFPAVHRSYKFCLITMGGDNSALKSADFAFFLTNVGQMKDKERRFSLSVEDFVFLNPETRTCPILRTNRDLQLIKRIHANGVRLEKSKWEGYYIRLIHLGDHAEAIRLENQLDSGLINENNDYVESEGIYLRLYEAKLIWYFDHRFATFQDVPQQEIYKGHPREVVSKEHINPFFFVKPRYWVQTEFLRNIINKYGPQSSWLLAYRDITNATNERTCVVCAIPETPATVSVPCLGLRDSMNRPMLLTNLSCFCLDFAARLKVAGTHLTYGIMKQLPILTPEIYSQITPWDQGSYLREWIIQRTLELTYTAWDLKAFARECGYEGPPFIWHEDRRFLIRSEIDAAFFHLYEIDRDDVDYIMETFPIVKRKDEQKYGEYRTKRVILECYDAMAEAMKTSRPYQTILDPLPGPPMDAQGNSLSMYQWDRDNWPVHIHPPHPEWEESLSSAWFAVYQKRWKYLEDDQVFPWDGREAFTFALITYLVQEKPREKFEFYRDAALLASRPDRCETLLLSAKLCTEYRQAMEGLDWLQFPEGYRIRPEMIRKALQSKQIILTDAELGATMVHSAAKLPPLPGELKPILPLILKATENLDKLQRHALEEAEAARITIKAVEIDNEMKALMVA